MHLKPGKLRCTDCGSSTNDPLVKSAVNSNDFLFSNLVFKSFPPEMMGGLIIYDNIEVDGNWYGLNAMVRCSNKHFTCAFHNQGNKCQYFDDLGKTVLRVS